MNDGLINKIDNSIPNPELTRKLTKENYAAFSDYLDKWVKIGHSTKPCNMERAAVCASQIYQAVGLEPPKYHLGPFNNPVEAAVGEYILNKWGDEGRVFGSENSSFEDDVALYNATLLAEVAEFVANTKEYPHDITTKNQLLGYQDTTLGFFDFMHTELNIDVPPRIAGLIGMAQVCGWWTPLTNVVLYQHRPLEIHVDAFNRLHNLNGPAVKFRGPSDICDVYSINGIRFSKKDFLSIPSKAT